MGPWTDLYAMGACIYSCMHGFPPSEASLRVADDRVAITMARLRGTYSDNLIEVVSWCMALDPLARPQSVFDLQKVLSREGERRYTRLSMREKIRLQIDTFVADRRKPAGKRQAPVGKAGSPLF
jgi:serine/threonine protein kinase